VKKTNFFSKFLVAGTYGVAPASRKGTTDRDEV